MTFTPEQKIEKKINFGDDEDGIRYSVPTISSRLRLLLAWLAIRAHQ